MPETAYPGDAYRRRESSHVETRLLASTDRAVWSGDVVDSKRGRSR